MKFSLKKALNWTLVISCITFILACIFSTSSTAMLDGLPWGYGMVVVLVVVLIGVFFDMVGVASAAAQEKPFHAMASEKLKGSKQAIGIVRNADRFSNFCNDVIGDISGIVSGSATAVVVTMFIYDVSPGNDVMENVVTIVFTGIVSAITVGGKAFAKSIAINYSTEIILFAGKLFYFMEYRLKIRVFGQKRKNGKRGKKRAARADKTS